MTTIHSPEGTLSERVLSRYPAPIAIAWRHVLRSFTKKEEHDRLLDLLEISAMTLAAALGSQYRSDKGENSQVEERIALMASASFGTWVDTVQLLQVLYSNRGDSSLGRRLAWELARKAPYPAQKVAIEQIARVIGQEQPDLRAKFSTLTFLNWVVVYRNEVAHAKPSPSEEVCRVRLSWLGPAAEEFLSAIAFLEKMPLVFVQRLEVRDGGVACEANNVMGWDLDRSVHYRPAQPGVLRGSLYFCASQDGAPTLRVLPVLFYSLCPRCTHEPRVFLLRKAAVQSEKGVPGSCTSVDYTCPVCGDRFRVEDPGVTGAFLDLLRRPVAVAEREAEPSPELEMLPVAPEPAPLEPIAPKAPVILPQERRPMINPNVRLFLTLYSQSEESNLRTRGLDEFGEQTYVATRLDTGLKPKILSGAVKLVILTGNAGDGKTAFIQQVEAGVKHLGATNFVSTRYGSSFVLNGCRYQTIYDGSEDEETKTNRQRLQEFFADFAGPQSPTANVTKVIAINEGHLRSFILNNWDYEWLGRQVHHYLEYENFRLDPSLLIINLNLRSVVDADLDSGASIFDRVLDRFLAPEFWQECKICSAAERCPIKFNVDSLTDSEYGLQIRHRLKSLYLITHFRRKQHMTVRDLRSSLAYIVFNRYPCEHIHRELSEPDRARVAFESRFYYNAAFGAYVADSEDPSKQDRLVRLFREIDVAPVANPRLDNLLNFNPPSAIGLLAQFQTRAAADLPSLQALFQSAVEQENVLTPEFRRQLTQRYHAAIRRKYFFESVESACAEAGYPAWDELLPLKSLHRFAKVLRDQQQLLALRDGLITAINLSERIYNEAATAEDLCVRTNASQSTLVKAFSQFPKNAFVCQVRDIGNQAIYIEYCPNVLYLVYEPDQSRALEISLDLFELLEKVHHGYVPSGSELKGFFLNLLMFKKQLTALPAQAIILTEDEQRFYQLEKTGAMTLSIRG